MFWDSFESAIHRSTGLTEINKFNYRNYSNIMYAKNDYNFNFCIILVRVVTKHMDILLSLEPVTSPHILCERRHLFDLVEAQVRGEKSLGFDSNVYLAACCLL